MTFFAVSPNSLFVSCNKSYAMMLTFFKFNISVTKQIIKSLYALAVRTWLKYMVSVSVTWKGNANPMFVILCSR